MQWRPCALQRGRNKGRKTLLVFNCANDDFLISFLNYNFATLPPWCIYPFLFRTNARFEHTHGRNYLGPHGGWRRHDNSEKNKRKHRTSVQSACLTGGCANIRTGR